VTPPVSPAGPKNDGGRTEAPWGTASTAAPRRSIRSPATRWSRCASPSWSSTAWSASTRSRHRPRAGGALGGEQGRSQLHLLPAHGRGVARPGRRGGEAFTADDVVFTYRIMMHPKTTTPAQVRYESSRRREAQRSRRQFTLKRTHPERAAKFSFKVIPKHGPPTPSISRARIRSCGQPIGTRAVRRQETITSDREVVLVPTRTTFKGRPQSPFISKPFADRTS